MRMSGDMKHRLSVAESRRSRGRHRRRAMRGWPAALPADSIDVTENLQGRYPFPMRILSLRR